MVATTRLRLAQKKEEKKMNLDLIWIEIWVHKNKNYQGIRSLAM